MEGSGGMPKKKKEHHKGRKQSPGNLRTTRPANKPQPVRAQVSRPSVTEFTRLTTVPVFATGEAGPPSGSPGDYKVTFVLGVPGVSSIATELDYAKIVTSGDSLLAGTGRRAELSTPPDGATEEFLISANLEGHLDRVDLTMAADSFAAAERQAHDRVMPLLSRMAVEADAAVEVKATVITELSTHTAMMGAALVGAVKPAPEFAGVSAPKLRALLATYREGLNCNAPSYQALAFYKIIEGVETFSRKERRQAEQRGRPVRPDPLLTLMPSTLAAVPEGPPWSKNRFEPFLGKSFQEVKDAFQDVIRNAVAHLTPGRELRVPDYMDDVEKCREAVPILRYIARELILQALADDHTGRSPQTTPDPV
jgi:hypothetical protein